MLRWMFWEQYNHEPNIATLRFWILEVGLDRLADVQRLQMAPKRLAGNAALRLMDDHLKGREWLVGNAISVADICLFAYTHVADEADYDLELYPEVIRWMEQIMELPNFVEMEA
jgi:glutathione S-transferase